MPLPLEFDSAEQRFFKEPADPGLSPDQIFDRNWAVEMLDSAVAGLRAEYEQSGRGAIFATLAPLVWDGSKCDSHAQLAKRLGMSVEACDVALHRLRRRLGVHLRNRVVETVATDADVDAELRHLIAAWGGAAAIV